MKFKKIIKIKNFFSFKEFIIETNLLKLIII